MTDDEMIAVIQAHKEGKQIESRPRSPEGCVWVKETPPSWDFGYYDYRVKPEPVKPREPREFFLTLEGNAIIGVYKSRGQAESWTGREVIEPETDLGRVQDALRKTL